MKSFTVLDNSGDLVEMTRAEMVEYLAKAEVAYFGGDLDETRSRFESCEDGELLELFEGV